MEGVMMRNGDRYAVAVRTVDGKIAVSTQEYHSLIKAEKLAHIPIVRGVFSFIDSLPDKWIPVLLPVILSLLLYTVSRAGHNRSFHSRHLMQCNLRLYIT